MSIASILVVDRDAEKSKALAGALEKAGYEVIALPDAVSASAHITSSHARFDLVIADAGVSLFAGTQFLPAFKRAFPTVPVIALSCNDHASQSAAQAGLLTCVTRPLTEAELLGVVREALHEAAVWANPLMA